MAVTVTLLHLVCLLLGGAAAVSTSSEELKLASYLSGDPVPISCLNRTLDSGEHVTDEHGILQYVPFLTCNETGRPLELQFLSEAPVNCTVKTISDEVFHLWEFYIHNDSPLACRVPVRPQTGDRPITGDVGVESGEWIPFIISLTGKLDLTHLHISTTLNVILHTGAVTDNPADPPYPGKIDSATAYSISPNIDSTRIIIGDDLPLRFNIRWYTGTTLPLSDSAVNDWGRNRCSGEHLALSTLLYCILTAICTAVACTAWFLGFEFPKRLRRVRVGSAAGSGYALNPITNGVGATAKSAYSLVSNGVNNLTTTGAGASPGGAWYTKKD
ncbi:hypothetical protein DRE_03340 [Drechslerella stenobrocha 248]|uniref:Autophagy-related protein 27 n=1 Tax=Drechslerella stenobrocha 248 TaxID=1043628 RepID=W7HSZ9_9PEZI|nr:hypothetical protein DRE_03340 [Drechslerella stenobrocha 248]